MNLNGGVGITTERHCPGNGLTPVGRQANLWRARPRTRRASDSDKPNRSKPDTSHPIASTEVQEHRRRGAAAPARSLIYWKAGTTGGPTMKNHGRRLRYRAGSLSGGGGSHPPPLPALLLSTTAARVPPLDPCRRRRSLDGLRAARAAPASRAAGAQPPSGTGASAQAQRGQRAAIEAQIRKTQVAGRRPIAIRRRRITSTEEQEHRQLVQRAPRARADGEPHRQRPSHPANPGPC